MFLSSGNRITIKDCKYKLNSAGFGGASLINVQDFVRENVITFVNCTVVNNHADFSGGGIAAGILFYEQHLQMKLISMRWISTTTLHQVVVGHISSLVAQEIAS